MLLDDKLIIYKQYWWDTESV